MLKKERIPVVVAAVLAIIVLILAFSLQPTFGSWSARVTNSRNAAGTAKGVDALNCYEEMQQTTKKYGGYLYHFHTPYAQATNDSLNQTAWTLRNGRPISPNTNWVYDGSQQAAEEPCVGVKKHAYFKGDNSTEGALATARLNSTKSTITANASAFTMPEQFTTETWINTSQPQGTVAVNSIFGNFERPVWRIQVLSDGTVGFQVRQAPLGIDRVYDQVKSTERIDDGQWHQVVTTWDFSTNEMGLYIDGQPESFKTSSSSLYRFTGGGEGFVRYGYSGNHDRWPELSPDNFVGYMSFAAIYPTRLTDQDVRRHWDARTVSGKAWPKSTVG